MQLICISVNQPDIMNIQHFRHSVKPVLNKLLFGILWHYHLHVWIKHVPHINEKWDAAAPLFIKSNTMKNTLQIYYYYLNYQK